MGGAKMPLVFFYGGVIMALVVVCVVDIILLRRRRKEAERHDAIANVMTTYDHITLCGYLAKMAIRRLSKKDLGVVYDIYKSQKDPDAFLFIIRGCNEEKTKVDLDDNLVFIGTATQENWADIHELIS